MNNFFYFVVVLGYHFLLTKQVTKIGTELGVPTKDKACDSYAGEYELKSKLKIYTIDRYSTQATRMNSTYDVGKSN